MSQIISLLAVLSILAAMAGHGDHFLMPDQANSQDPQVTPSSQGLILEWNPPPARVIVNREGITTVEIPGYRQTAWPGAPELPVSSAWIALPANANPTWEILGKRENVVPLTAPLSLTPAAAGVLRSAQGQPVGGALAPASVTLPFPHGAVVFEQAGVIRGQRLAQVHFYPVRPSSSGLWLTASIQVAVNFNVPTGAATKALEPTDTPWFDLSQLVVNPEQLQPSFPEPVLGHFSSVELTTGVQRAAIEVAQPGVTAVTYSALSAAGFPVDSINPQNLHLARSGETVAYEWVGNQDDQFKPGERLLFVAEPRFSRWASHDVYYLWEDPSPGLRMNSVDARPDGLPPGIPWTEQTFEENIFYTPDCYCAPIPAGRDGDRWTWDKLQVPTKSTASYVFYLPAVNPLQPGLLTVWMIGFTDLAGSADHKVDFSLNGQFLGSKTWDGKQAVQIDLVVPAGGLHAGDNSLTLKLPVDRIEGMWLDAFRVRFSCGNAPNGSTLSFSGEEEQRSYTVALASTNNLRAYDVTAANQPFRLTGLATGASTISLGDPQVGAHRYWLDTLERVPGRIRLVEPLNTQGLNGADYVAISPKDFIPSLDSLIQLRQSQGLQVTIENVQAIYDAYGDGRPDPEAIHSFLVHAYSSWEPRPAYVLLVGDGTSDPKRYNSSSSKTFIPPYLAVVDPWAGETASDNRYATVDGTDILPDLLIGRLPVNNTTELSSMVTKILNYETQSRPVPWSDQGLFVADNPDQAGDFPKMATRVVHSLPTPPLLSRTLFFDPDRETPEKFRAGLRTFWQQGAGLVLFTGHASILQWAEERFLEIEDLPALKNESRLPVLLEMTCFTGSFQVPGFETLDESLLRQPDGGVVAAWGATGLGVLSGHRWLAEGFIARLYGDPHATIGQAALAGKLHLSKDGSFYEDLVDTFTLLGDPATQVIRSDYQYLPVIMH